MACIRPTTTGTTLPPAALDRLAEFIYRQASLRFNSARIGKLERRVAERVAELGLPSPESYLDLINRDRGELNALLGDITTKQTSFFRLPRQFDALAKVALPALEEELGRQGEAALARGRGFGSWDIGLRTWCAGCSTGEEAYSLAMALLGGLRYPRAWRIEVLAGDVSRAAVETASRGVYLRSHLASAPEEFRRFYEGRGEFAVMGPEVRRILRFGVHNLRELSPVAESIAFHPLEGPTATVPLANRFHLIFCRNVMIYFDHEAQQRLIDGLYRALVPGGWLFTGDAELLNIFRHRFQPIDHDGACIYQKPTEETDR